MTEAVQTQEVPESTETLVEELEMRELKARLLDAQDDCHAHQHNCELLAALTIGAFNLKAETIEDLVTELKDIIYANDKSAKARDEAILAEKDLSKSQEGLSKAS